MKRALHLFIISLIVVLANAFLWLDSLDQYLSSRYHLQISSVLPDSNYVVSKWIKVKTTLLMKDLSELMAISHESIHTRLLGISAQKIPQKLDLALNTKNIPQQDLFQKYSSNSPSFHLRSDSPTDVSNLLTPKILFAGDSMMQGIAPLAIAELRKKYPAGLFVDLSQQSTGLSVNRYFDWPAKIQEESLKQGFNIVVIFLGPNDPWDIYESRVKYVFPSEAWREKYRSRIREIMDFALLHKIHIIWIGLPNMGQERIKQGALIQNTLFKEEISRYHFDYLSTEDIFGTLDEPFNRYIPDPIKGQTLVRGEDGVHFTVTGLRLINQQFVKIIQRVVVH